MPIDNDHVSDFAEELNMLIQKYSSRISTAEVIGILKLMSDDVSEKTRNFNPGPHPLS